MFVRLILWIIIIYIVYRVLVRYIFPFLVRYFIKNSQEKFYRENPNIRRKKEGEVSIDYSPKKNNNKDNLTDDIGEYVDYEEED